jgi:hypothetical protein
MWKGMVASPENKFDMHFTVHEPWSASGYEERDGHVVVPVSVSFGATFLLSCAAMLCCAFSSTDAAVAQAEITIDAKAGAVIAMAGPGGIMSLTVEADTEVSPACGTHCTARVSWGAVAYSCLLMRLPPHVFSFAGRR